MSRLRIAKNEGLSYIRAPGDSSLIRCGYGKDRISDLDALKRYRDRIFEKLPNDRKKESN